MWFRAVKVTEHLGINRQQTREPILYRAMFTMCFSIAISGFYTSLLSLAPRYTGTLTSIAMMSGYLERLVTPRIVPFFNRSTHFSV
ncbi:hypothetical protein M3Y95_00778200 [Aphelenchoides besseyi]|nr:hypothetical protein M3Y95_00778200 [Aphelenchoides besseyi]